MPTKLQLSLGANSQQVAHANQSTREPESEYGMRHKALEPCLQWLGRFRCGGAQAERGLQYEEWEDYGANAIEKRNQKRRSGKPVTCCKNDQHQCEHGTDRVVGDPANRA